MISTLKEYELCLQEKHPNPGVKFKGTTRTAFLPYNEKGCKVHRMLQKAFSQQLIFTVGKSVTTGKENVVTWNDIHHKTRADGGPERYEFKKKVYNIMFYHLQQIVY